MDWLNFFRIAGYIALFFGVICTVAVDFLKNRQDKVNDSVKEKQMTELVKDVKDSKKLLEPFNDLASKLYPGLNQKEALDKLQEKIDSLDKAISSGAQKVNTLNSELNVEKKTIKTFDVAVSVEFSGKWENPPYSQWLQTPKPLTLLKWTDHSMKNPDLEFSTSKISYETINSSTGLFKNTLIIQPGEFPLGQLTDILRAYDEMAFWIVLSWPENLLDPKITFNKVDIVFSINGSKKGELHYQPNVSMDYSEALKALVPGKASWLQPRMELNGKPVDVLKMSLE
jgi:hypothetical protein